MGSSLTLEIDDPRWMRFLEGRSEATPFHHPRWAQLLADCYGLRPFVLAIDVDGELVAGLPILEVRSLGRRRKWVTLPFTDAIAPLGSGPALCDLADALESRIDTEGVGSVEVRGRPGWGAEVDRGYTHILALDSKPDALLRRFSKSSVQGEIGRAARAGVAVRVALEREDLDTTFYGLHLRTRRRQGVPVQPRRFFSLLWERMIQHELGFVLVAELDGRPIASGVFLAWNGTMVYKLGASERETRVGATHAVVWEAIRRACREGMREFDFGRTDSGNEGLRAFKARWATEELPLIYTYLGTRREAAESRALARILHFTIRHSPTWVCRAAGETLYKFAA